MIHAVMIMKELSAPIIMRIFTKAFEEDKVVLMSQFLEAIRKFAEHEIGDKLYEIRMGNYIFYLKKAGELSLVIVADPIEAPNFVDDIAQRLTEYLRAYSIDELESNLELQRRISIEVAAIFLMRKAGIDILKEIAEGTKTLMSMLSPSGIEIKVKSIKPVEFKPKRGVLSRLLSVFRKTLGFEVILKLFEEGEFKKVLAEAETLFSDPKYGDLAKALYVMAGLFLHSRPIEFPAPKLEDILVAAESIKDPLLKSLILERVNAIGRIDAIFNQRMLYIENREKIWEIINKGEPEKRDILLITLLGIPDMYLLTKTIEIFHKRSTFITAMALAKQLTIQASTAAPRTLDEWLRMVSVIRKKFDELKGKKGVEFLLVPYLFALWQGIETVNASFKELEIILNGIDKLWKEYGERYVFEESLLPSCYRAAIIFFGYYAKKLMELTVKKDKPEEELRRTLNHVIQCINKVVLNQRHHRVLNAMIYRLNISALLDIAAKVSYELKQTPINMPDLVMEILDPDMIKLWHVNRFHFLAYLVFLMRALGYTLASMPAVTLRNVLLKRICENLYALLERTRGVVLLHMWALEALHDFLKCLEDEESQKLRESVLSEIKQLPNLLQKIILKRVE